MKLIMTVGLPGSGKSTWAKNYVVQHPKTIRINKDDIRAMIGYTRSKEDLVRKMSQRWAADGLHEGYDVIIDDTNLNPRNEPAYRQIAEAYGAEFAIEDFRNVPLKECIKNDLKRLNSVGKDVILKMHKQYLAPKPLNSWSHDPSLPDAIICDIDGTLAIHVARGPFEMEKCETDAVDPIVLSFLKGEHKEGRTILFVSGRGEEFREKTEAWLKKHVRPANYQLHMRPFKDVREDSIIKQEIFDREIKRKYNIMYVLDDRNRVVDMWRRNGLKCLQVAEGDF